MGAFYRFGPEGRKQVRVWEGAACGDETKARSLLAFSANGEFKFREAAFNLICCLFILVPAPRGLWGLGVFL